MVYLITDGFHTKIGVANNSIEKVEKRLRCIQTGSPYKLWIEKVFEGSFELESLLHRSLDDYRLNGEWFVFDFEINDRLIKGFKGAESQINKYLKNSSYFENSDREIIEADYYIEEDFLDKIKLFSKKGVFIYAETISKNLGISKAHARQVLIKLEYEISNLNFKNTGCFSLLEYNYNEKRKLLK